MRVFGLIFLVIKAVPILLVLALLALWGWGWANANETKEPEFSPDQIYLIPKTGDGTEVSPIRPAFLDTARTESRTETTDYYWQVISDNDQPNSKTGYMIVDVFAPKAYHDYLLGRPEIERIGATITELKQWLILRDTEVKERIYQDLNAILIERKKSDRTVNTNGPLDLIKEKSDR